MRPFRRPSHSYETLLHIAAALLCVQGAKATCFWPNATFAPNDPNSIAPDDTACNPNAANSVCCGTGWTCLSDSVCLVNQNGHDFYYRGTCTDRTWNHQACPGWCLQQNDNTTEPLIKCTNSDGSDWYCCAGDPNCDCTTGKFALKLAATQPSTLTVIGSTTWPGFVAGASTSTSSIPSSKTSSTRPSSSVATPTTTTTTAAGAAATGAQSPLPSVTASSSHSNNGLAIGLGVGLGIAALAIAALAFFLLRNRRQKKQQLLGGPDMSMPNGGSPHQQNGYYASEPSAYTEQDMAKSRLVSEPLSNERFEADTGSHPGRPSGQGAPEWVELPGNGVR